MSLDAISVVKSKGGYIVPIVCDNCPTNQAVYKLMGGPGKTKLADQSEVYLVFDYVHVYKNLRNNWITEKTQQLPFGKDGKEYIACWSDVVALHQEGNKSALRLTNTSVHTNPLQRQCVPLVRKVFNGKIIAAFKALKSEINFSEGTEWFKVMNVKDRFVSIRSRDELRSPRNSAF